ncbi:MAG: hypothetical protein JXB13_08555 [Phycisphaerae bacterium]|nr:hypothetical protein [Phycisphaerae bacterium]
MPTHRLLPGILLLLVLVILPAGPACGPEGGALLYWMGAGQKEKVGAEFTLGPGPILVLVDDPEERLSWAEARDLLADETANALLANKATEKVVSNQAVQRLRRSRSDFEDRGCREIGEMLKAERVLWLQVADFFASEETQDLTAAARFAVSVRVINAKAQTREEVRLWPEEMEGRPVKAELSANEMSRLKGRREITQALTAKLGNEVARLFHEHALDDLMKP